MMQVREPPQFAERGVCPGLAAKKRDAVPTRQAKRMSNISVENRRCHADLIRVICT